MYQEAQMFFLYADAFITERKFTVVYYYNCTVKTSIKSIN